MTVIAHLVRPNRATWGQGEEMNQKMHDVVAQNSIFLWIALATAAILLIPLVAMQFTADVQWDKTDFIVMGALLFGMASLFVLAARRIARRHRLLIGVIFVAAFLYIWAELAVGVLTNLGS
jgi:spore maturation protein SpmA